MPPTQTTGRPSSPSSDASLKLWRHIRPSHTPTRRPPRNRRPSKIPARPQRNSDTICPSGDAGRNIPLEDPNVRVGLARERAEQRRLSVRVLVNDNEGLLHLRETAVPLPVGHRRLGPRGVGREAHGVVVVRAQGLVRDVEGRFGEGRGPGRCVDYGRGRVREGDDGVASPGEAGWGVLSVGGVDLRELTSRFSSSLIKSYENAETPLHLTGTRLSVWLATV